MTKKIICVWIGTFESENKLYKNYLNFDYENDDQPESEFAKDSKLEFYDELFNAWIVPNQIPPPTPLTPFRSIKLLRSSTFFNKMRRFSYTNDEEAYEARILDREIENKSRIILNNGQWVCVDWNITTILNDQKDIAVCEIPTDFYRSEQTTKFSWPVCFVV